MQCPKCSQELFEVEQNLVALDCCPGCHGLWFDSGELDKLTGGDDAVSKLELGIPTELTCPRCEQALTEHATADANGVSVERCHECGGIWLDRAEIEAFRKRERTRAHAHQKPEVLTLKELLLRFVDSSIDSLRKG